MKSVTDVRKKYIDAVKGVNILIVLFNHAQGIPLIGALLSVCFMQVFFVLAGYTYKPHNDEDCREFIKKKAARLLVPYFSYAVVLFAGSISKMRTKSCGGG